MPKYIRGDVAMAYFPYEEDKGETKLRPVVIIEVYSDSCFSCMTTGTNRSHNTKGFWVEKDSDAGKQMGLWKDSFINAERTDILANIMFPYEDPIGTCPFIDELEDMV